MAFKYSKSCWNKSDLKFGVSSARSRHQGGAHGDSLVTGSVQLGHGVHLLAKQSDITRWKSVWAAVLWTKKQKQITSFSRSAVKWDQITSRYFTSSIACWLIMLKCEFCNARSHFRVFYAVYGKVRRAKCLPFCCMERKHARCSCVTGSLLNLLLMASLWIFLDRVVRVCLQNFNFLPIESQLEIRTAKFLQAFLRQRIHCVCYLNSVQSRSSIVLIFF